MPCPALQDRGVGEAPGSRGRGTEGKVGSAGCLVVFTGKNGLGMGAWESCRWTPGCTPERVVVWSLALG